MKMNLDEVIQDLNRMASSPYLGDVTGDAGRDGKALDTALALCKGAQELLRLREEAQEQLDKAEFDLSCDESWFEGVGRYEGQIQACDSFMAAAGLTVEELTQKKEG